MGFQKLTPEAVERFITAVPGKKKLRAKPAGVEKNVPTGA
jgi:hypothetical protein